MIAAPMRCQARSLGLSAALPVVRIGAELIRPRPLAIAVDYAIDGTAPPFGWLSAVSPQLLLVLCGAAVVAISIAAGVLDLFATRSAELAAERIGSDLRRSVFDRSIGLSLRWHDRLASGELVSRLTTDVGRLLDAIVALSAGLLPAMLTLVGVLLPGRTFGGSQPRSSSSSDSTLDVTGPRPASESLRPGELPANDVVPSGSLTGIRRQSCTETWNGHVGPAFDLSHV